MAIDATGAPTSLGIPKFNTSVDAPSGNGSNAQMDAIDALIAARVSAPAAIAAGEVPVWNGAAWVRSSVTNIGPASLGSGVPDATKFLRGDGSWASTTPGAMTLLCDAVVGRGNAGDPAVGSNFDTSTILGGNIPQTYKHLRLLLELRNSSATWVTANMTFNGDSGANYDKQVLYANQVAANANQAVGGTWIDASLSGTVPGADASAGNACQITIDLLDYTGTTFNKGAIISARAVRVSGTAADYFFATGGAYWRSTAALTRIAVASASGNFVANSRFSLYGIN